MKTKWMVLIASIGLFLFGIYTVVTGSYTNRAGTVITGIQAVSLGILIIAGGVIGFIGFTNLRRLEKKMTIHCPSCGRKKELLKPGKYRCTICGNKFLIENNGKVRNID